MSEQPHIEMQKAFQITPPNSLENPTAESAREKHEIPPNIPQHWSSICFSREQLHTWSDRHIHDEENEITSEQMYSELFKKFSTNSDETTSETDKIREGGQDKIVSRPDLGMYLVCDGVSSQESKGIVNKTVALITQKIETLPIDETDQLTIHEKLTEIIQSTLDEIATEKKENKLKGGTTLTLCIFRGNNLFTFNLGDSTALVYRPHEQSDKQIEWQTTDHSFAYGLYKDNREALALIENHFRRAHDPKNTNTIESFTLPVPKSDLIKRYLELFSREKATSKRKQALVEIQNLLKKQTTSTLNPNDSKLLLSLLSDTQSIIVSSIGSKDTPFHSSITPFGPDDVLLIGSDSIGNLTQEEIQNILQSSDTATETALELGTKIFEGIKNENPRAKFDDTSVLIVKSRPAKEATDTYITASRHYLDLLKDQRYIDAEQATQFRTKIDLINENNLAFESQKTPYENCRQAKKIYTELVEIYFADMKKEKSSLIKKTETSNEKLKAEPLVFEKEEKIKIPEVPIQTPDPIENDDFIIPRSPETYTEAITAPLAPTQKPWWKRSSAKISGTILAGFTALASIFIPQMRKNNEHLEAQETEPVIVNIGNAPKQKIHEQKIDPEQNFKLNVPNIDLSPERLKQTGEEAVSALEAGLLVPIRQHIESMRVAKKEQNPIVQDITTIQRGEGVSHALKRTLEEKKSQNASGFEQITEREIIVAALRAITEFKLPRLTHIDEQWEFTFDTQTKQFTRVEKSEKQTETPVQATQKEKSQDTINKSSTKSTESPIDIMIGGRKFTIGKTIEYLPIGRQPGQYTVVGKSPDGTKLYLRDAKNPRKPQFAVNAENINIRIPQKENETFKIDGLWFEKLFGNAINMRFTTESGKGVILGLAVLILHEDYNDDKKNHWFDALQKAQEAVYYNNNGALVDTFDPTIVYEGIPNTVVPTDSVVVKKDESGKWIIESAHLSRGKKQKNSIKE
jgi:serine/threonine protein phosphatase PrpC